MSYTITLSDEEYKTLAAEAERTGASIEALVHAAVRARYVPSEPAEPAGQRMNSQDFLEYLYRKGVVLISRVGRRLQNMSGRSATDSRAVSRPVWRCQIS